MEERDKETGDERKRQEKVRKKQDMKEREKETGDERKKQERRER